MKKILSLSLILTFTAVLYGQAKTPESAAQGLWNAWKQNNKTAAAKYAAPKVIKTVWENDISDFEMDGCEKYNGEMHCFYRDTDGGVLNFMMTKTGTDWKATSVEYYID